MKKKMQKLTLKKSTLHNLDTNEQNLIMGGIEATIIVYATTPQAPPQTTSRRVTDCDCTASCPTPSYCGDYSVIQCPTRPTKY
jgi:hypothetical protein